MLDALRARIHDPDRAALHRALRVAIVLPSMLALGVLVLQDREFALLAAFGSFSALAMADFMGPTTSRLAAYFGLAVAGSLLVALGTLLSGTLWPAVVAMLAIGVALQFTGALGGQFALGNNAGILAFVVAVMVPADAATIPSRVAGWIAAMACAALATSLLWPRHQRRDLYERIVEASRGLAAVGRDVAAGAPATAALAQARVALDRVRDAFAALGFRPIGPPSRQQALLGLIDELGQCWRFAEAMVAAPALHDDNRRLAAVAAATLDAIADVVQGCADERRSAPPDVDALVAARRAQLDAFDATERAAIAAHVPGTEVVAAIDAVFPVRVFSFTVLSMAIDAIVLTGRDAHVDDTLGPFVPPRVESPLHRAVGVLGPHLAPGSVWFRNSARAGVALALSVLVAKVTDIQHAFWVVLATLTVLRSNVATTGSTVVSAVGGTVVGFVVASAAILAYGSNDLALWVTLPFAVFLGVYAPAAVSLAAGQAMFALLVVVIFNLMQPAGWETSAIRLEAVVVGAAVALAASLIMWPQGASAALRHEVARHVRAARHLTEIVYAALLGTDDGKGIAAAREATLAARRRAEEALAAYAGERGAKRVSLPVWGTLVRTPVCMRTGDDAVTVLWRARFSAGECPAVAALIEETVAKVSASFDELADRLDDPNRTADASLGALIADLDMVDGTGRRRAAIAAATAEWIDAHRDAAVSVTPMIAVSWAANWLRYLAHQRALAEDALAQVQDKAAMPWWR
jgi:uncharacterized membrane protein YccC